MLIKKNLSPLDKLIKKNKNKTLDKLIKKNKNNTLLNNTLLNNTLLNNTLLNNSVFETILDKSNSLCKKIYLIIWDDENHAKGINIDCEIVYNILKELNYNVSYLKIPLLYLKQFDASNNKILLDGDIYIFSEVCVSNIYDFIFKNNKKIICIPNIDSYSTYKPIIDNNETDFINSLKFYSKNNKFTIWCKTKQIYNWLHKYNFKNLYYTHFCYNISSNSKYLLNNNKKVNQIFDKNIDYLLLDTGSSLTKRKYLEEILEIFIKNKDIPFTLLVKTTPKVYDMFIKNTKYANNFKNIQIINQMLSVEELTNIYEKCNYFIYCSKFDGYGLSLAQAIKYNLFIFTFDGVPWSELLELYPRKCLVKCEQDFTKSIGTNKKGSALSQIYYKGDFNDLTCKLKNNKKEYKNIISTSEEICNFVNMYNYTFFKSNIHDYFKTEFIKSPIIMKYKGDLNNTHMQIKPANFINSKYGIITSSNINSGLVYESNYFIKYINSKSKLEVEIFYFSNSSVKNSNIEYKHSYIYPQNNDIKAIYNHGISLKEFINNKKVILIYEIFSEHIFDIILNLNIKIIFLINSDCFINWDDKKNRNSDYNLGLLYKLKTKYNEKFIICTKNITTQHELSSHSIISQYIPMFIGSDDIIDYESFKRKYKNVKDINVAIILGAGYQKLHRKSIEQYLDILYEIIKKHENIIFNIYTPTYIEYKIKSFKNLHIHINKSDQELQAELINTSIAFYFSKHDGLAITPIQLLSCGCYTISTFNDCFDIFDCYILKSYIDTKICRRKNISNVFEVKDKSQIKVLFENALRFIANIREHDLIDYYNNIVDINSYKSLSLSLLFKEFISESYITKKKIILSAATYPLKKCGILYNVENLIMYADNIYIYLNDYKKIPKIFALLNTTQVFIVKVCIDMKALSKFNIFKEHKNPDFILTIDDDLYYSQEYIQNMIKKYSTLKRIIPKDLIVSSVGRVFNNVKIKRYESPTKIIRIDNNGKSNMKLFHKQYKDEFVELVGTGNSLFYNTKYLNDTINSIYTSNISFKNVSLDETLSIVVNNKNIIMVSSSMDDNSIFLRNICLHKYRNIELSGLHELKTNDIVLKQSIEKRLQDTDYYNITKFGFDRINMLIIGWWSIEAFPVNIITKLFSDLNYNIHFYGLKLNTNQNKTNNDISGDINDYLIKNNIQIIYWFNWKFDIDSIKNIKKKNPNVKNVMFNWDPVDSNLNPSFNKYFEIFDFTFISQELNSNYNNKKYIKFYPGFNYNIKPLKPINDGFLGDVCFVITNYYNNRDKLIQKLINNNINVHIYGPEKLKLKFPTNYKRSLLKNEVYNIYNHYKISVNYSIDTTATEYVNERVAEVFYSNGLMLTNLENTILINNFNCLIFKNLDDCVKITKSILMDYTKNLTKINKIKTNAFNTAIEVLDYRKSILKKHMEIIKII